MTTQKQSSEWLIPVLLAIGAAAALWYYWMQVRQPESVAEPTAAPAETAGEETEALPGPLHPVAPLEVSDERPELVPLPSLDQSDEYFKLGLVDVLGTPVEEVLVESGIIERIDATVDNLPRNHVAERIRPVGQLPDQFQTETRDDEARYTISAANSERYAPLVSLVANADLDEIVDLYQRFYPLFQNAYEGLGYPDGYFNDRLVETIDHLLAAPEPGADVALVRPHVLFEYEDPELEALSSGQKIMIRMGPENSKTVRATLRELRNRVVNL